MPLSFLKGNGASIDIQLDRPEGPYHPGDIVHADITLQCEKEMKARQFRAGLLAWEEFVQEDSEGDKTTRSTLNEYVEEAVLVKDETLQAGYSRSFQMDWRIPTDAFPPYFSELIRSGYQVVATLDLGSKRDIRQQVAVRLVVPPPGKEIYEREYGESSHPKNVHMQLWLPRLEWVEGETIEGKLLIDPKDKTNATGVRIQINRDQRIHAPRHKINHADTIGRENLYDKIRFEPGRSHEFPFNITIPEAGSPTRQTESTTVTYKLEGIISRRLRKDYKVNTEIYIHNGLAPD